MTMAQRLFGTRAASPRPPVGRSRVMTFDKPLLWVVMSLLMLGMVMVYSASIALPESSKYAAYKHTHFLMRQAIFIAGGLFFGGIAFCFPMRFWERWAPEMFMVGIALLVLVLVPGVGKAVNGAHRWLPLKVCNLQPSEVMKLLMVFYAASYAARKQDVIHRLIKGMGPMAAALGIVGVLLLRQPDLGALVVIVSIAIGILFLGGVGVVWFGGICISLMGIFSAAIVFSPWRLQRLTAYLDPWDKANAMGKAYQLTHSLIAFGRGELLGVGLGGSVEKLHYLPEPHTDFLMAVVGEELGLAGALVVVLLFFWLVNRAIKIGRKAVEQEQVFSGLVAQGIGIWIGVQAFINIGVNLGLLPTKGLTLPLMSYGGSGILMNCIAMAILLRVDYENKAYDLRGES